MFYGAVAGEQNFLVTAPFLHNNGLRFNRRIQNKSKSECVETVKSKLN